MVKIFSAGILAFVISGVSFGDTKPVQINVKPNAAPPQYVQCEVSKHSKKVRCPQGIFIREDLVQKKIARFEALSGKRKQRIPASNVKVSVPPAPVPKGP